MCQLHCDSNFICPICGDKTFPLLQVGSEFKVLSELQVIGAGSRLQKCHKCKGSDRDRLVYLYLRDYEDFFDAEIKVLHVAPEDCIARAIMAHKNIEYIAGDSFEHGYVYPDYIHKMDVLDIPYEKETFDFVICNHTIECIQDDIKAMKEIFRVLKYGGKAILQVPISPVIETTVEKPGNLSLKECELLYGHRYNKRIYSKSDYIDRLSRCGFVVNVKKIASNYPQHSLNKLEELFLCIKVYE
jgi:SAM-dependent methyltransferase